MLITRQPLPSEVTQRLSEVRVAQVRNYLATHGWVVRLTPRGDMLEFFPEEDRDKNPVPDFFPLSESSSGYVEWVESFVRMLSQCEQRSPKEVLEDLLAASTDETTATHSKERDA